MPTIMKPEQININALVYSQPKSNTIGGQTVFINDQNRNKIRIHIPKCYLPFGVSEFNQKYSINFSLNSDSEEMQKFKKFLTEFDNENINQAVKNTESWFKKKYNKLTATELYNPCIKQTNANYPPNFKAKLILKDGRFEGTIYDTEKNEISIDQIKKGCYAEAIVELNSMYFLAREYGTSWKVVQIKVYPTEQLSGYSFIDDD